ncbi:MAG TPA: hypothetical protein VIA06_22500 [Candidatus Dormibacteraeota bacterium]|jgi:hypothetical protein|nr:hypothetical protein [Candidatus Dormibacteraeota bacterium]
MSEIPLDAQRSPDGRYWWDGGQWQLVEADPAALPGAFSRMAQDMTEALTSPAPQMVQPQYQYQYQPVPQPMAVANQAPVQQVVVQVAPQQVVPSIPKSKAAAILLAVFLGPWTWVYTYERDRTLWWISFFTFGFLLLAWPTSIVMAAVRSSTFYDQYPYGR